MAKLKDKQTRAVYDLDNILRNSGKDKIVIGRASPDIFIKEPVSEKDLASYVSRLHGELIKKGSMWFFVDLSKHGTIVNGDITLDKKIEFTLRDNDIIYLGKGYAYVFRSD